LTAANGGALCDWVRDGARDRDADLQGSSRLPCESWRAGQQKHDDY
jgi:hypothetical protein